jgi:hypothetical protein
MLRRATTAFPFLKPEATQRVSAALSNRQDTRIAVYGHCLDNFIRAKSCAFLSRCRFAAPDPGQTDARSLRSWPAVAEIDAAEALRSP